MGGVAFRDGNDSGGHTHTDAHARNRGGARAKMPSVCFWREARFFVFFCCERAEHQVCRADVSIAAVAAAGSARVSCDVGAGEEEVTGGSV